MTPDPIRENVYVGQLRRSHSAVDVRDGTGLQRKPGSGNPAGVVDASASPASTHRAPRVAGTTSSGKDGVARTRARTASRVARQGSGSLLAGSQPNHAGAWRAAR